MTNATIAIVCYKSKTLANGEHPLMIRVSKDGKKTYKSLGLSVHPKYWSFSKNMPKPNCPNREVIIKILMDKKAELQSKIIELNSLEKDYTSSSLVNSEKDKFVAKTVGEFYITLIKEFQGEEKCGCRLVYKDSYNSLKAFTKGKLDIPFSHIDMDWLTKYEKWLRKKDNKETTISILFRTLRSTFNKAIQRNYARRDDYPFNEFKISKFDTSTCKRALSKSDILTIKESGVVNGGQNKYIELSKDIFIFSYLCGGINFTDIANLTHDNLHNDRIQYIRQKTKKIISIPLCKDARDIISKYGDRENAYLFPILNDTVHLTPQQKKNRIHKIIAKVNSNLKLIAAELGIETNLTTYVARHSFATVLKKSGVSTSIISETLGHSSEKVTQIYLDSFDNEQISDALKCLL